MKMCQKVKCPARWCQGTGSGANVSTMSVCHVCNGTGKVTIQQVINYHVSLRKSHWVALGRTQRAASERDRIWRETGKRNPI